VSGVDAFVVAHNHAATLPATLAGLAAQRVRPERVVVLDNASSDASLEAARGWSDRLPLDIVAWAENRGFSAAANEALRRTSSPWVLSLNPDCRLEPDYLAELLGAVAGSESAGAATGLLRRAQDPALVPTGAVDSAGMVVHASLRHLDRGSGRPLSAGLLRPAWVFGASAAAALYRRAALADVAYSGGEVFDETFFAYREDADLAWRLQRRGWRCLYWPRAQALHARGLKPEARRRGTPEVNRHSVRNRFLLRWGNADWRWMASCFPFWLLRDALVVAACLTVERTSLPALREAFALRSQHLARGRANRARATVSGWRTARWFLPFGHTRGLEG
jgi:GT2 family glycosyltransferase